MPRTALRNLSDAPPATPGILTTEFWKTLAFSVVSLLIATGVITPVDSNKYKPIIDGFALIAPAIALGLYSLSRGKTKAAAIEATANVIAVKTHSATQLRMQGINLPASPLGTEQVGGEA
jgi:hypothetical protein